MFLYFILGMLTVQVIFPILDTLTSLIITTMEVAKGKLGISIARSNTKIQTIGAESDPPLPQIGFTVNDYPEEEEEEDY